MRPQNWPELLHNHIASIKGLPFVWGENDCCTYTCDYIKLITGTDPMEQFRGTYTSLKGSLQARKEWGSIRTNMRLHFEEIAVPMAQRGDAVIYVMDGEDALGLCNGLNSYFLSPEGYVSVPTLECATAWRVK